MCLFDLDFYLLYNTFRIMTEREIGILSTEQVQRSAFESFHPESPPALIEFLRFSEREGAYGNLSLRTKRALKMRYVEGLDMSQIGDVLEVSKQAVSQSLKHAPETLYRKMTEDVVMRRTHVLYSQILMAYSLYRIELDIKNPKK